jgi:1-aminocyclopropane-1-carboxylate deaminase
MELKFLSYTDYTQLQAKPSTSKSDESIVIPYGGYGPLGVKGAREILDFEGATKFDLIIASAGSGTMGAGLLSALNEQQQLLLFSAVKNNYSIESEIKALLSGISFHETSLHINYDYHFGGFAKTDQSLLDYMNQLYTVTSIPTDIVYTGKLMFGINDMLQKRKFRSGSNILIIHSGGLQGNRSLKNNELIF